MDAKDFFKIYVFCIAVVAILVLFLMIVGKAGKKIKGSRKKKKNSKQNNVNSAKSLKSVQSQNVSHSELYLSYYNNIGTMSFEELDKMRDVLFEFYTSVESVKNATGLMSAYGGMEVTDETVRRNKEQLLERRQKEIRGRPYGCRTYGEAHDLVEKAHKDKEYWEYLNR